MPSIPKGSLGQPPQHEPEEGMSKRCLAKRTKAEHVLHSRLAARRVVAVDERARGEQRQVLG